MNYAESKKKIDKIRQEYGCKGEVLFRTAIQYVVEYGKDLLNDDSWFKGEIISIDAYHDKEEMEGKTLWITRGFEKSISASSFLIVLTRVAFLSSCFLGITLPSSILSRVEHIFLDAKSESLANKSAEVSSSPISVS